jgi:hypothetical protein
MTAHIALLICFLGIVPTVKPGPAPAQITAEALKRANHFCNEDYVYPDGATPLIVQCQHDPVPDCFSTVNPNHPYSARCKRVI